MERLKMICGFRSSVRSPGPPFPTQQLFVLALCRICEPIAFMSIFPYIYYMIESFHITTDSNQIAIYAGMTTSAFAIAEFSSSVIWGRISDRVGRKPVLLGGLAGTAVSMLIFGFAKNLPTVLIGRALGGLLNGNISVLQTTVAELVTVKEHQPRAYSIMPFVWCLGSILGPALGGALAQPVSSYPSWFSKDSIFGAYPFLLPNLVCVVIIGCGLIIGTMFLHETHAEHKHRRDPGVALGNWLINKMTQSVHYYSADEKTMAASLLEQEKFPIGSARSYTTLESSGRYRGGTDVRTTKCRSLGAQKAFTRPVLMNIVAYGIMAYHAICFDQMMPIFLSLPVSHAPAVSLIQFIGGFGMSSGTVGVLLAVQGIYSMLAQLLLFPFLVKRLGNLRTFRAVILIWPCLYIVVPYLVFLPSGLRVAGIVFCLLWRITTQVLAFPSMNILITNSAPSFAVLGLINGVAGSTACLSRAFGPTLSGMLFSWGISIGYLGIAWWTTALIALLGAFQSYWMEEGKGRLDITDEPDRDGGRLEQNEP